MNTTYSDKEKFTDALMSEKFITSNYNSFANECARPEVKQIVLDILNDEHAIQHEVFVEMQNHGWYEVKKAPESTIQQTKTQIENSSC